MARGSRSQDTKTARPRSGTGLPPLETPRRLGQTTGNVSSQRQGRRGRRRRSPTGLYRSIPRGRASVRAQARRSPEQDGELSRLTQRAHAELE